MLNSMHGMQNLQQQLQEVEYEPVRGGIELHRLPEWTPDNALVDLQDWLLLIHPQMSDLTATSSDWWDQVMEAAKSWYKRHQLLKPIEKLKHEIKPPAALMQKKWRRLEKQGSSLLEGGCDSLKGLVSFGHCHQASQQLSTWRQPREGCCAQ